MIQTERGRPAPGTGETAESATNANENDFHSTTGLSFTLDAEHLQELEASAISPEVMTSCGVYSAHAADELPECVRWVAGHDDALPALVYPSREADGTPVVQVKPARPLRLDSEDLTARSAKYVSGSGVAAPQLPVLRRAADVEEPVWLIVEGVKQSLAALSWAPPEAGVLRIAGIYGWMRDGAATEHLSIVEGGRVVVIADADARTNRTVFDGATELGEACAEAGATDATYATVPGGAKTGLDDYLATRAPDERAARMLQLMQSTRKKPAAKRPARKIDSGGRRQVDVTEERGYVARALCEAVVDHSGGEVFEQAEAAVRVGLDGSGRARMYRLAGGGDAGPLLELLTECVMTVRTTARGVTPGDPTSAQLSEMLHRLTKRSRPLRGISERPVMTDAGAVITQDGYEPGSRLYVRLSSDLADLEVPDAPSRAEAEAAVSELLYLLHDYEFEAESDRVRALAMLITAVVRPSVKTAPLWMLSASKPGQGKGKLAALCSILMSGRMPHVQPYISSEDELGKSITAEVLAGSPLLFLDEARGELSSSGLQALVTSESWSGRILGETRSVKMDHSIHLIVAGNNLTVGADMARRVMPVRLYTEREDPSVGRTFTIPDLEQYAVQHRRDLVRAALIVMRHWYATGCPAPTARGNRLFTLESYGEWQRMVGGALEAVGVTGLMDGVEEMRQALDDGSAQWRSHLAVLDELGQSKPAGLFTIRDVLGHLSQEPDAPAPPEVDLSGPSAAHVLGRAYMMMGAVGDKKSAWHGGRRLCVSPKPTRKGAKQYYVETRGSAGAAPASVTAAPTPPPSDLFEVSDSIAPVIGELGETA